MMVEREGIPDAVQNLLRAIPERLPGKQRVVRFVLRAFRSGRPVFLRDLYGNGLWCPSVEEPIAAALISRGVYEPDTVAAILAYLNPKATFIDVGANIGATALPVAASRPEARILCVEADPGIAAILRRNIADNARSNVSVVGCIAGPFADPAVAFYRAPAAKFGMGSIGQHFDEPPLALRQQALDDVLDELGLEDVHVVKLDVEGAELGALRGLQRRCRGVQPPTIIFEFSDWAEARIPGQAPGDAQALLLSLGYRLFRLGSGGKAGAAIEHPLKQGAAMILAVPTDHARS
jgi:FkbM family methyltransferase